MARQLQDQPSLHPHILQIQFSIILPSKTTFSKAMKSNLKV